MARLVGYINAQIAVANAQIAVLSAQIDWKGRGKIVRSSPRNA